MKKLFTFAVAATMIAAMAATSMAFSEGEIIYKDDDDYESASDSLVPGKDYYVVICEYDSDAPKDNKPSSIKWEELEVNDPNEDDVFEGSKAKRYVDLSSSASKIKIATREYVWAAKLDVKNVKASNYDDSIEVDGTISYRLDGEEEEIPNVSFSIEYEDGGNEFEEDEMMYEFDRNDDVEIDFPDGDGRLVGVANKDFKLIASMNTDYNSTIGNKYPNANLDFYNGNGVSLTYIKNARLHFEADADDYLYEITDGNKLVDLTSTYDKGKGEFIVSARSLGKYVVSNRKLDASSSASGSTTPGSSSSSSSGNTSGGNVSTGNTSLDNLYNLIQRNFSNKFTLLSYGTSYEVMPKAQNFVVSVNLSGMNTNDLYLYTYDAANNRLIGAANKPKVGADGKLSFVTNTKGYYVISSGQLTK